MATKQCTNPGCAFNGTIVTVDAKTCIGCGRDLKSSLASDLKDLLGNTMDDIDKIFGKKR